ncbi:uncharacterized protein B0P05DRAFT_563760, partial [Gilbertella persicaria]|uniref:uncharacterized protein n=1 Tax=Gilbertella persicaria TaxID=101096 RepID=UPI00221E469A
TLFYFFIFSFCFFTFSTLVSYGLLWSLMISYDLLWSLFLYLIYFKNAFTDISVFSRIFSLVGFLSLSIFILSVCFPFYLVGSVYWCVSLRGFQCSILIVVGLL